MSLGSYMYRNVSKSNVSCRDTSLSDNITVRKWGLTYYRDPLHPSSATKVYIATVPFMMGDTLLSRKATTKIVRVIEVTKDRGAQAMIKTEDQVLILLSQFCQQ